MKLLTLNTHSLIESDYKSKLNIFVDTILKEKPDIIAMQEVNQTETAEITDDTKLVGLVKVYDDIIIRKDNHAANIASKLNKDELNYHWVWLPIKTSYGKYEEGIAVMSRFSIEETDSFLISRANSFDNWRTRKILGIKVKGEWFYSVHMGWWTDEEDPFAEQWNRIENHMSTKENVWLMGDFNVVAGIKGEGYDMVSASGWYDTYVLAEEKDNGFTVDKSIDGWRDSNGEKMRIDYIWTNKKVVAKKSSVMFNGLNYPIVSDHYGVMAEIDN